MLNIQYVEGDLFECVLAEQNKIRIIPHVCNNRGAWGKGFVLPLGRQFPAARTAYQQWALGQPLDDDLEILTNPTRPFELGALQVVEGASKVFVANMVAQVFGGKRPLFYNSLVRCMDELADVAAHTFKEPYVFMCPLFGSGLAGGDWAIIEKLIEDCWCRRDKEVIVCLYNPKE